ncbi:MAG TPA: ACT domain-containing protein [Actinomycetota bacterium]|nr:ACT domain-containing protein [Actinomycetota bacterium]
MSPLVLTVTGRDRPGVVAAVAKILFENGCNVTESSMTQLCGTVVMMLVLDAPEPATPASLEEAFAPMAAELEMQVSIWELPRKTTQARPTHVLTVHGQDESGILHRITHSLSGLGINITDLNSRVLGGIHGQRYALMLELEVPEGLRPQMIEKIGDLVGVQLSVRPLDDEVP